MAGLVEKIEINCDMGEGFGRWKMVSPASTTVHHESVHTPANSIHTGAG